MTAIAGNGNAVRIVTAGNRHAEGIFAAKEINRIIGGIDMLDAQEKAHIDSSNPRSFSDIAVLCRTHRQVEEMGKYLQTEGIPYIVTGREEFLEEKTVREAVGFFRSLYKAEEETDRKSTMFQKYIGEEEWRFLRKIFLPLVKKKPVELINRWMTERGILEDEPLTKLASMALFHKTMEDFLDTLAFGEEGDLKRCGAKNYKADAVSLMTLHAAKGLEFPAVLIMGVREHSIPLQWGKGAGEKWKREMEEERRLLYVGMTRAREELICVTSGEVSAFLKEFPEEGTVWEQAAEEKKQAARQLSLFDWLS